MFNEATFREIILPLSGNVNDYAAYLKGICRPGRKQWNLQIRRSCARKYLKITFNETVFFRLILIHGHVELLTLLTDRHSKTGIFAMIILFFVEFSFLTKFIILIAISVPELLDSKNRQWNCTVQTSTFNNIR